MAGVIKVDVIEKSSDTGTGIKLNSPLLNSSGTEIMSGDGSITIPSGQSIRTDSITDSAGTGAPDFPYGLSSSKTMSNFGIIETLAAGNPLINASTNQNFTYTAGEEYFVFVDCRAPSTGNFFPEVYRINSNNTVSEVFSSTSLVSPSIPSSGTLRISTGSDRNVVAIQMIRMDW